jgi:serine/threonine protein kinase
MSSSYAVGDQPVPGAGYSLAAFLGRGGFGEVWKATAPGGAEAALKIIRLGSREGHKELRALQLVKRIHHTHLVPIIAFWIKNEKGEILDYEAVLRADRETIPKMTAAAPTATLDSLAPAAPQDGPAELIIAMGLGDQNLYDRLEQCQKEGMPGIPDDELLGYLEDSAEAIDFLNSPVHDLGSGLAGIQHCDIKPHNLVLVGGSVQICDFGLARMMGTDRATTAAASIAYAAPECLVKGKPSDSTDQYCLAVSFVELKTGQLPYDDLSMASVIDAKRNDKLDFSSLPEAVQSVLRRATSSDPAKRYPSCREMVRELRRALSLPDHAANRSAKKGVRQFVAAILAVAVVASGAVWAWHRISPEPVPAPIVPATGQPELASNGLTNIVPVAKSSESPTRIPSKTDHVESPIQEGNAYLASGTKALENKNFATAVADLERASKLLPRDARIFSRLGAAWLGRQQWDKAVASYTTAIEIEPFDNDYLCRGRAYLELKATDKAIADFAAAVRLNPSNAAAYVALGDAHLDQDEASHAIAAFSEAIRICASDPGANFPQLTVRLLRANAYLSLGKKAEAADDLTHVLPLLHREDRQSIQSVLDALDALAVAYADAGQYADAVKWAKKSVELAPDEPTKNTCRDRLKAFEAKESASRSKRSAP